MSRTKNNPHDVPTTLSERVQSSRALGSDPSFVLHGGGNTSAKGTVQDMHGNEVEVIWVKGSGWDLATIEAPGLPALDLNGLRALRALDLAEETLEFLLLPKLSQRITVSNQRAEVVDSHRT